MCQLSTPTVWATAGPWLVLTPGRAGGRGEARGRSAAPTKSLWTQGWVSSRWPHSCMLSEEVRAVRGLHWEGRAGSPMPGRPPIQPHVRFPVRISSCFLSLGPTVNLEFCGSSQIAEPDDGLRDPLACPDLKAKKALPALINFYSQVLFFTLKSPFWPLGCR